MTLHKNNTKVKTFLTRKSMEEELKDAIEYLEYPELPEELSKVYVKGVRDTLEWVLNKTNVRPLDY